MGNKEDEKLTKEELEDAKMDINNLEDIGQDEYFQIFFSLSKEQQRELYGKNLYWVEGIWIRPDGSTTNDREG